jgi:REP element-mobilizing transposase RayT
VHVVVQFATTASIAKLVKDMKGASSHLVNHRVPGQEAAFKWQGAYGVFPAEPESLLRVVRYVERQEEHHRNRTTDLRLERTSCPPRDPQHQNQYQ